MTPSLFPRTSVHHKFAAFALAALFGLGFAANAAAEPTYPEALEKRLALKCIPTCLLCHTSPEGGASTVRGNDATELSIIVNDNLSESLLATLRPAALNKVMTADSDNDGMIDIDELKAGRDPFTYGDTPICSPTYGCGARIAKPPAPRSDGNAAVMVSIGAAISLGLWQRRRAQSKRAQ